MHIETNSQPEIVQEQLEREGWHVDRKQDGSMLATNQQITQEPEARRRLDQMGLLTSSRVRIEFVISSDPDL
jgi:hypothetical protein